MRELELVALERGAVEGDDVRRAAAVGRDDDDSVWLHGATDGSCSTAARAAVACDLLVAEVDGAVGQASSYAPSLNLPVNNQIKKSPTCSYGVRRPGWVCGVDMVGSWATGLSGAPVSTHTRGAGKYRPPAA